MIRKILTCYLLITVLIVPLAWSQERAVRPLAGAVDPNIRQALVIGNSEYRHAGRLRNPVNDARAIGNTLQQLGFEVKTLLDADQRKMERAIRDFGDELRSRRGVGLFYYAGHGMQFGGENYLLPTDIDPSTEEDVRYDAVPLGKLLAQMRAADNAMNVVILDACRNNPFSRSFRTFSPGLAQVNAAAGTFISFATAPGQVAADGDGNNGLFTGKLLEHLRTPGLKIEEVFKRTTADVYTASNERQAPWVQYSVIGDFFFVPRGKSPQVPNQTALSDLQKRADVEQAERLEQQRLEAQWKDWQQKMQEDYERVLAFEKQAVGTELKVESWQRFLGNWTDDNPYSQQDSELRSGAQAKLSYWLNTPKNKRSELPKLFLYNDDGSISDPKNPPPSLEKLRNTPPPAPPLDNLFSNSGKRNDQKVELNSNPGTDEILIGEAAKQKLYETNECAGCDLREVKWKLIESARLSGANLRDADLGDAYLNGATLIRADLSRADLLRADLRYAFLSFADLNGANLREADLREANLDGAILEGAKFCNTKMPDGSINNRDCDKFVQQKPKSEVKWGESAKKKLLGTKECSGCDLSLASLIKANLYKADLTNTNLSRANLRDADLQGASLRGADLREADLRSAVLWYADLTNTNLNGANLYKVDLYKADLTGVNLQKVDLTYATLCNTIMPDGSINNRDC